MKVVLSEYECIVTREKGDPRMRHSGYGRGTSYYCGAESMLLYHVKKELIAQGYDVLKKHMWKDGHMVAEDQQYIRTRNVKAEHGIMVWNGAYQIYDAGERFNEDGVVPLMVSRW